MDVGGLAMMHNWEEQQAWLEKAIEVGQAASRPDGASTHIDAEKMKQFRVRLRTMFEEVDVDHSGALDLEEMRKALIGFGLHFSDDLVAELFRQVWSASSIPQLDRIIPTAPCSFPGCFIH